MASVTEDKKFNKLVDHILEKIDVDEEYVINCEEIDEVLVDYIKIWSNDHTNGLHFTYINYSGNEVHITHNFSFTKAIMSKNYKKENVERILKEILPRLKYDKINDKFVLNNENSEVKEELCSFIDSKCKSIKMNRNKCCVCLEYCLTKTRCKHSICRQCYSKLKQSYKNSDDYDSDDEDCTYYDIKCPYCRELTHIEGK